MKFAWAVGVVVATAIFLQACSSNPSQAGTPATAAAPNDGKPLAELVGPDEQVQKQKAIQTRLSVGMEALRAKDPDRARRHITRALEIDPSSAEAHNAMALYYRYEGDDKHEEEHYKKAIRYNSGYSQARNNYAVLLYKLGRYKEAIDQLEKAANDTTYEQRQMVFLNLGRSYARVGDNEKAASALQRSLRLDTTQPDVFIELADVLFAQGKTQDAQSYFNAYTSRTRQTARSLWLGIRIESALGGTDKVANYEFQLAQMFANSSEYAAWRAWKGAAAGSVAAPGTDTGSR